MKTRTQSDRFTSTSRARLIATRQLTCDQLRSVSGGEIKNEGLTSDERNAGMAFIRGAVHGAGG